MQIYLREENPLLFFLLLLFFLFFFLAITVVHVNVWHAFLRLHIVYILFFVYPPKIFSLFLEVGKVSDMFARVSLRGKGSKRDRDRDRERERQTDRHRQRERDR